MARGWKRQGSDHETSVPAGASRFHRGLLFLSLFLPTSHFPPTLTSAARAGSTPGPDLPHPVSTTPTTGGDDGPGAETGPAAMTDHRTSPGGIRISHPGTSFYPEPAVPCHEHSHSEDFV